MNRIAKARGNPPPRGEGCPSEKSLTTFTLFGVDLGIDHTTTHSGAYGRPGGGGGAERGAVITGSSRWPTHWFCQVIPLAVEIEGPMLALDR